jgi:DNA adenine methylase
MGNDSDPAADAPVHLQHVLIKWTGGKRRQSRRIVEHFPRKIATYHEPFLGGGAVLYELLGRTDIRVDRIKCGDTCVPLIDLWQVIRDDPVGLTRRYAEDWAALRSQGKSYYYEVRDRFNRTGDPYLFFFLLRTCRNGLVRFNRRGEFNTGFHRARPGMEPETVEAVLADWWRRLGRVPVRFAVRDYREVSTAPGDLLYLDPPYLNQDGQYYGGMIDFPEFFGWLRGQRCGHLLSLNGFLGDEDRTVAVPGDLYDEHLLLDNGISPFDRLNGGAALPLADSLYIKRSRRPGERSIPRSAPPGSASARS